MQSMLNLHAINGVPLCLCGITNPLSLSKEMADHERRRKAMKKQRSSSSMARESVVVHANQEQMVGTLWNFETDSSSSSCIIMMTMMIFHIVLVVVTLVQQEKLHSLN
ncbi:uncharacterized protein LOC130967661 [Arachis stenosperma]|uniref:uncharacterized protein LOC130967661 n=1 Tax=Arachis stenosperma TaxID=217475 RepID=UPI0025AC9705|nr:uncharacterized protein LOC130967661 [Arachis stenosperma]